MKLKFLAFATIGLAAALVACWQTEAVAQQSESSEARLRTWTDKSGKHHVQAELIEAKDENVRLKTSDGRTIDLPLEKLSDADQNYIRGRAKKVAGDDKGPADKPLADKPLREKTAPPDKPLAHDTLVTVKMMSGGMTSYQPGIVVRREGKKVLVLARDTTYQTTFGDDPDARYALQTGTEPNGRSIVATWITYRNGGQSLLEVEGDGLPGPIAASTTVKPTVGMQVKITGLADPFGQSPALVPFLAEGTIREVQKGPDGEPSIIQYALDRAPPDCGVMTDQQGGLVAVLTPAKTVFDWRTQKTLTGVYNASAPALFLTNLETPVVQHMAVGLKAVEGDTKTFLFVAYLSDPFHKVPSPQITFRSVMKQYLSRSGMRSHAFGTEKLFSQKRPIVLARRAPDPEVAAALPGHSAHCRQVMWVGEYRGQEPADHLGHYFEAQLVYEDGQGPHYGPKWEMACLPRVGQLFAAIGPPKLSPAQRPGVGEPIGGWGWSGKPSAIPTVRITSDDTRLKKPLDYQPAASFPTPTRQRQQVAGAVYQSDGVDVVDLNFPSAEKSAARHGPPSHIPPPVNPYWAPPAVFSDDGKSLYLVDHANSLHKLDGNNLQDRGQLDLGQRCADLGLSQGGLLVARPEAGVVWIVDPATLEVRHEIPVTDVFRLAASPKTPIGFAIGSDGLFAIDTVQGQIKHFLPTDYCNLTSVAPFWRRPPHSLPWQPETIGGSADGKSLYVCAGIEGTVHRYRVDGDDLAEQATGPRTGGTGGPSMNLCISRDGKWIAHPCGGGNFGATAYNIAIYDGQQLTGPAFGISVGAYPELVAFDCANNRLYSPNTDNLLEFGTDGKLQRTLHFAKGIKNVVVHPEGGRLLFIGGKGASYCDFEPGRLAKKLSEGEKAE